MSPALLAAAAALIELDATQAGQLGLSRPLVVGPLLGWLLGAADQGVFVGAALELFSLKDVPVGGRLPLNATAAAAAATLLAGAPAGAVPLELAFPAGLGAGWAHAAGEGVLRRRRDGLCASAEARAGTGRPPALGRRAAACLAVQAAWTFAVLLGVLAARGALLAAWAVLPGAVRDGAGLAWTLSPWLAAAALLHAAAPRRRAA